MYLKIDVSPKLQPKTANIIQKIRALFIKTKNLSVDSDHLQHPMRKSQRKSVPGTLESLIRNEVCIFQNTVPDYRTPSGMFAGAPIYLFIRNVVMKR